MREFSVAFAIDDEVPVVRLAGVNQIQSIHVFVLRSGLFEKLTLRIEYYRRASLGR